MRNFGLFFTTFLFFAMATATLLAQTDHFKTSTECVSAEHVQYHPSLKNPRPLSSDEMIVKSTVDACYDMVLPDRLGSRGYVWLQAGTLLVVDKTTSKVLKLAECGNKIGDWIPTGPVTTNTTTPTSETTPATTPVVDQPTDLVAKVDCPDLTPLSMTTPARGILRRVVTHVNQPCNGATVVIEDEQMTIENRKMQMHRDDLMAKVQIATVKAEAKSKQPSCGFWCGLLLTPAYPVGYGYSYGYGGGGYNTGYNTGGGGYGGGHRGGGGGNSGGNTTYGPGLNTGGAY